MDTSKTRYKQCALEHPSTGRCEVAWIPNIYATKNRQLQIAGEDGWRVAEVYSGSVRTYDEFGGEQAAQRRFRDVLGG